VVVCESAGVIGLADAAGGSRPVEPRDEHEQRAWADQLAALDGEGELAPRLQSLATDVLHRFRAIQQENAALLQQVATLEAQVEALLSERIGLVARVRSLEEQIEHLQAEHASEQAVLEKLVAELERASRRMARVERQPIPIRPFTAPLPGFAPPDLLPVGEPVSAATAAPDDQSPAARFQHPAISDEETLLGAVAVTAPLRETGLREPAPVAAPPGQGSPAASSYALIAHPFARFSDLGQFQAAVQALPSVHNVRVRRFAQGTLEMRVDYDGSAPLTDVLRGLPLPVEDVAQEEPFRLRVRLAPVQAG
jgi:hypothetical protein